MLLRIFQPNRKRLRLFVAVWVALSMTLGACGKKTRKELSRTNVDANEEIKTAVEKAKKAQEKEKKALQDKIDALNAKLAKQNESFSANTSKMQGAVADFEVAKAELETVKSQLARSGSQQQGHQTEINNLNAKMSDLVADRDRLAQENESLQAQLEEAIQNGAGSDEVQALQVAAEQSSQNLEALEARLQEAEGDNSSLRAANTDAEAKLAAALEKLKSVLQEKGMSAKEANQELEKLTAGAAAKGELLNDTVQGVSEACKKILENGGSQSSEVAEACPKPDSAPSQGASHVTEEEFIARCIAHEGVTHKPGEACEEKQSAAFQEMTESLGGDPDASDKVQIPADAAAAYLKNKGQDSGTEVQPEIVDDHGTAAGSSGLTADSVDEVEGFEGEGFLDEEAAADALAGETESENGGIEEDAVEGDESDIDDENFEGQTDEAGTDALVRRFNPEAPLDFPFAEATPAELDQYILDAREQWQKLHAELENFKAQLAQIQEQSAEKDRMIKELEAQLEATRLENRELQAEVENVQRLAAESAGEAGSIEAAKAKMASNSSQKHPALVVIWSSGHFEMDGQYITNIRKFMRDRFMIDRSKTADQAIAEQDGHVEKSEAKTPCQEFLGNECEYLQKFTSDTEYSYLGHKFVGGPRGLSLTVNELTDKEILPSSNIFFDRYFLNISFEEFKEIEMKLGELRADEGLSEGEKVNIANINLRPAEIVETDIHLKIERQTGSPEFYPLATSGEVPVGFDQGALEMLVNSPSSFLATGSCQTFDLTCVQAISSGENPSLPPSIEDEQGREIVNPIWANLYYVLLDAVYSAERELNPESVIESDDERDGQPPKILTWKQKVRKGLWDVVGVGADALSDVGGSITQKLRDGGTGVSFMGTNIRNDVEGSQTDQIASNILFEGDIYIKFQPGSDVDPSTYRSGAGKNLFKDKIKDGINVIRNALDDDRSKSVSVNMELSREAIIAGAYAGKKPKGYITRDASGSVYYRLPLKTSQQAIPKTVAERWDVLNGQHLKSILEYMHNSHETPEIGREDKARLKTIGLL